MAICAANTERGVFAGITTTVRILFTAPANAFLAIIETLEADAAALLSTFAAVGEFLAA